MATFTFVATFQVDTDLTTDTRVLTFINISTVSLVYKLKPSWTVTFMYVAFLQGLSTPVLAVSLLVTHFVDIYAFSTSALEFARS